MTKLGPDFSSLAAAEQSCNAGVFDPSTRGGHYESYFQRANHPSRPLAFWQRFTVFSPKGAPERAIGELWAIYFDGETGKNVAVKSEFPIADCIWRRDGFGVRIADAELNPGQLRGSAGSGGHTIAWDLTYDGGQAPLFFFPLKLYTTGLPKAKALVGMPHAEYKGQFVVDGQTIDIDGWVGSQNHNWGSKHTDHYAWGQVAGFADAPDAFLEVGTARIKIGPLWTPFMTPLVLRLGQETIAANSIGNLFRNRGQFAYFDWTFEAKTDAAVVKGRIHAPADRFVGLTYYNPPGGSKTCLNSKLAACDLAVTFSDGRPELQLHTDSRAAFEILTDDGSHGVKLHV